MAPIFVTMLFHVGVSPAGTQLLYRIGDSTTNGITPLYSMYPLILGWVEQYDENAGIGTVTSLLLPYMIFSMLAWIVRNSSGTSSAATTAIAAPFAAA